MNMDSERYAVFQDYLGLSTVAWGAKTLDNLMEPPPCRSGITDELVGLTLAGETLTPEDPLDTMRCNAYEDFLKNGVSTDMDELDQYQAELRKRTTLPVSQYSEFRRIKRNKLKKLKKLCVFCKNNNEPASLYQSHILKDLNGRVICPILRNYTCPLCAASGDTAHTIRYCPKNSPGDITSSR